MAPTKVVCYIPTPSSSPRLLCPGGYKERVKSQFEARGKEYDARGDYHRFLAQTLIATANLQQGETVLDAACGTGIVSYLAADKVAPDGSVTGVDISKTMLDVVRS